MEKSAAPTLTLVVEKGPREGETLECKPGRCVQIGRVLRGNTFTIKDGSISQKHLSIVLLDGARWTVTDLDTSNGTFLNSLQIEPSVPIDLHDGDTIKIGLDTTMTVRMEEAEAAIAAAAGVRRFPRWRGEVTGAADEPKNDPAAGGGGRRRGRPKRGVDNSRVLEQGPAVDSAPEEESQANLIQEDVVEEPEKETLAVRRRTRAAKKTSSISRAADSAASAKVLKQGAAVDSALEAAGGTNLFQEVVVEEPEKETLALRRVTRAMKKTISTSRAFDSAAFAGKDELEESVKEFNGVPRKERGARKKDNTAAAKIDDSGGKGVVETTADAAKGSNSGETIKMEDMTLGEWFDRLEKYLPRVIHDVADEIIADLKAKSEWFNEYLDQKLKLDS